MSAVHPTGDAPGAGAYYCMVCGWKVSLAGDEQLPLCGGCPNPAGFALLPLPMSPRHQIDATPYHRSMPVSVEAMLRAHSYMRTGRPSDTWDPDVDDQTFFALLGEMIVVGMHHGNDLGELTLSVTNVSVMPGAEGPIPQATTWPSPSPAAATGPRSRRGAVEAGASEEPFVTADLEAAIGASDAIYGYTQASGETGGITAMFPAATPPDD